MKNLVGFPGLSLEIQLNRVAFTLFGHDVYWYGLIIVFGLICGTLIGVKNAKKIGLSADCIYDYLLWAIPACMVGARAYYVATSWKDYRDNPLSVLYIWEGGIAIYGAVIAAIITMLIFCKIKKLRAYDMLDCCCSGLILGQAIGRWGNFVNGEAYGTVTSLPWRMSIEKAGQILEVHPTFLYESLWNIIGFALLLFLFYRHRTFGGKIFWTYLLWYGIGRFFIEGLRTDSLYIGIFRISQIVALISVILSSAMLIFLSRKSRSECGNQKEGD